MAYGNAHERRASGRERARSSSECGGGVIRFQPLVPHSDAYERCDMCEGATPSFRSFSNLSTAAGLFLGDRVRADDAAEGASAGAAGRCPAVVGLRGRACAHAVYNARRKKTRCRLARSCGATLACVVACGGRQLHSVTALWACSWARGECSARSHAPAHSAWPVPLSHDRAETHPCTLSKIGRAHV